VGSWITRNLTQQVDLLKRHAEILDVLVKADKPIGIIKLSKMTGHSPHLVRYSLRELENADVVRPTARGSSLTLQSKGFLANLNKELSGIQTDLNGFADRLQQIQNRRAK